MNKFLIKNFSISTKGTSFFDRHVYLISYVENVGSRPEEGEAEKAANNFSSVKASDEEVIHDVDKDVK